MMLPSLRGGDASEAADRGQLGVFMVLVLGAIALVVVSIVLLFGMDIAGSFADGIEPDGAYADSANSTTNSTADAFELFGTIPAAAVLAVLIGGMVGAISMRGNLPGMGGGMGGRRRR